MKKRFKDIILIFLFLLISIWIGFILVPRDNERTRDTTMVVRLKNDLGSNQVVKLTDLETIEMGSYGLPREVVLDPNKIVGKYATTDIPRGILALDTMFQDDQIPINSFLYEDPELDAISFDTNLARAVGGIPERGDFVKVIIYMKGSEYGQASRIIMHDELENLEVISISNARGTNLDMVDEKNTNDNVIPGVVTVRANAMQQALIVQGMYDGIIHLALRPRTINQKNNVVFNDTSTTTTTTETNGNEEITSETEEVETEESTSNSATGGFGS
ncbi:RcpC/CpaB family pilus assembly protein [Alkaliphilus peptidifermentans]|uniref:Flp pilus assembly protein RcpC/CpaB n=1 Tax=Alkaliphilus peptidifermentans DSM 18978 TaxID=1120976 RepID=A0A1G5DUZ0_9FIRM|nr:RcpC/CpaB family pilus assembly protein [Alkaliphilus peptidifermentans]SCY18118.1 Flp pilus assembly protein RcpC/CpaB [Alkaliphilus peptidifermentans DSM 18978]